MDNGPLIQTNLVALKQQDFTLVNLICVPMDLKLHVLPEGMISTPHFCLHRHSSLTRKVLCTTHRTIILACNKTNRILT
jgi:hypothetical protein